jgi:hypothetical protein
MRRIRDDHTGANLSVKAVIFDLGGVVFDSPLAFIRDYEVRHGLPENIVARVVGGYGGEQGAWQRLERGELMLPEFCEHMDRECAKQSLVLEVSHVAKQDRNQD